MLPDHRHRGDTFSFRNYTGSDSNRRTSRRVYAYTVGMLESNSLDATVRQCLRQAESDAPIDYEQQRGSLLPFKTPFISYGTLRTLRRGL